MIDGSVKVLGRLWDKIALTLTDSGDLSHLVDVRPLRRDEIRVVADELNPARNADTHRSRLESAGRRSVGLPYRLVRWKTSGSWIAAMARPDGFTETAYR